MLSHKDKFGVTTWHESSGTYRMKGNQSSRIRIDYAVRDVVPYINWIYYFHAWGMEPRFAAVADIHDCPSCRASWAAAFPEEEQPKAREAATLYTEATALLRQWADKPICHALLLLAEAYSDGDDIVIDGKRIPFLRQQHAGRSGYTLCLSDFIRGGAPLPTKEVETTDIANRIGVFATTVSLPINQQPHTFQLQCSTLADRLAEATAERLHEEVRKHIWGYAQEEQLTMRELHEEKFQGIRPAVGYPSLPDQSINFLIDELLEFKEIGITLTPNGAMSPSASVSGFMLGHPQAHYFSIGSIGEDQLQDYSRRRGVDSEALRSFLINNL